MTLTATVASEPVASRTRPPAGLERSVLLNLVDDSLAALVQKGNASTLDELYNPLGAFAEVHHVSFYPEDRGVLVSGAFRVHVLWTLRRRLPGLGHVLDVPLCLAQLWWIAMRHRVAVVRGRGALFASALGIVVARWRRIPCVVSIGGNNRLAWTLHGQYPVAGSRRLSEQLEAWVLRHADEVWCPSEYARTYALELGVRPERTVVLPWRLTREIFEARAAKPAVLARAGVDLARPIVLFVGRLEADKQPEVVLHALPELLARRPDAQLVMVGDGSLRLRLEQQAGELGVGGRVWWLGFQTTGAVRACLQAASVVCVPMSGFVVFEAAAFAKPMVVCDVEWHREFVEEGRTGLLVPDRDSHAMADGILALLERPQWAQELGAAARRKLQEAYDPSVIALRELERIVTLLGVRR